MRYRFSTPPHSDYTFAEYPHDYAAFEHTHDLYPPAPYLVKVWKLIDNVWHEWTNKNKWEPRDPNG